MRYLEALKIEKCLPEEPSILPQLHFGSFDSETRSHISKNERGTEAIQAEMDRKLDQAFFERDGDHRDIIGVTSAEWKEVRRLEEKATSAYHEGDLQSFTRALALWRSLFEKGCAERPVFGAIIKEE